MLAVEKTHRINVCIYGRGSERVASVLRRNIPGLKILPGGAKMSAGGKKRSEVSKSRWYKNIAERMTGGDILRIRRENSEMTQAELSEKTGIAIPNISLMEAGRRAIGVRTAKKLAAALECDVSDFIV